ncbi:MAG TPA: type II secretion system protein [Armatimonadetes bacterium]|nr:type II secretion system protein [Armatimonadota bacterium]
MRGRKALTLIELLVVIAILAVLASIAFTFGDRLGEGERVVQCQAQLKAIYRAIKMYKLDTGGVPPFYPSEYEALLQDAKGGDEHARQRVSEYGLNLLYALGYIDSRRVLKCPDNDVNPRDYPYVEVYWAEMNGYQTQDPDTLEWPYLPDLGITDPNDPRYRRQLQPATEPPHRWWPSDDTVITWCRFHRGLYRKGGRDMDIVLFWDGSVEAIPAPANHFVRPGGVGP